jgi:hypothetical protein
MTADNMPRCKTCRRWQRDERPHWEMWGTCRVFRDLIGIVVSCDEPGAAVTVDTRDTWGCVEHEERGE